MGIQRVGSPGKYSFSAIGGGGQNCLREGDCVLEGQPMGIPPPSPSPCPPMPTFHVELLAQYLKGAIGSTNLFTGFEKIGKVKKIIAKELRQ